MRYLVLCLLLATCKPTTGPTDGRDGLMAVSGLGPGDTVFVVYVTAFIPPPEYRRWYAQMERCSGLKADYEGLSFFVTPQPWRTVNGWTYGLYHDRQILVNAPQLMDSLLVGHEMLHDLLVQNGWKPPNKPVDSLSVADFHPSPPFTLCAPIRAGR